MLRDVERFSKNKSNAVSVRLWCSGKWETWGPWAAASVVQAKSPFWRKGMGTALMVFGDRRQQDTQVQTQEAPNGFSKKA